jgi:hypothetical protein
MCAHSLESSRGRSTFQFSIADSCSICTGLTSKWYHIPLSDVRLISQVSRTLRIPPPPSIDRSPIFCSRSITSRLVLPARVCSIPSSLSYMVSSLPFWRFSCGGTYSNSTVEQSKGQRPRSARHVWNCHGDQERTGGASTRCVCASEWINCLYSRPYRHGCGSIIRTRHYQQNGSFPCRGNGMLGHPVSNR